jgi:hypothetical protein
MIGATNRSTREGARARKPPNVSQASLQLLKIPPPLAWWYDNVKARQQVRSPILSSQSGLPSHQTLVTALHHGHLGTFTATRP